MLKRLIEVALPLKEVSEQSSREKRQLSRVHMYWAPRPLQACRAVVFASLIPDPDDPECPKLFKQLVMDVLGSSQFRPTQPEPSPGAAAPVETKPLEDTPRNRCLEFIKHLVRWENSNEPDYIDPARKLIRAAHKILHPDSPDDAPKILDPFAGRGAIPLEALRLGCEAHAIDINPVAHLIQLCTLVYPQKFGRPLPTDAPVPDYITDAARENDKDDRLFGGSITEAEAEYRRNPLAYDVAYWAKTIVNNVERRISHLYPKAPNGESVIAYLWARTARCTNPQCQAVVPLIKQYQIAAKNGRVLVAVPVYRGNDLSFKIGSPAHLGVEPNDGTVANSKAQCPCCNTTLATEEIKRQSRTDGLNHLLMCLVTRQPQSATGKTYVEPDRANTKATHDASAVLEKDSDSLGTFVPNEKISGEAPRRISPPLYGLETFASLFNPRQTVCLATLCAEVSQLPSELARHGVTEERSRAIVTCCALIISKLADHNSALQRWHSGNEQMTNTFSRQALPMMWDYCEANPFSGSTGSIGGSVEDVCKTIEMCSVIENSASVNQGSASRLPLNDASCHAVITDPPYYDAIPYAALSDFFYVWLKRGLAKVYPDLFRAPLTPKADEIIEQRPHSSLKKRKDAVFYQSHMKMAFEETARTMDPAGIVGVMFAHKSTAAWESLIAGLMEAKLLLTASWPLNTEMKGRMTAQNTAALASSVTLVCRKRSANAGEGLWDDVRSELRNVANERLDFFWDQGIRGADFFISAIGPALSVFGRYERVGRLSGEEVTVGEFLDEVRDLVTHYALSKIIKGGQVGHIDAESQFYVVWKWSYGEAKMPADEAFKLAQALGFSTEEMWDKTGVLEKSGQNVAAMDIAKRMKVKSLGEPKADGVPASLIDVLHRLCAFRDKADATGAGEFLARSGHGKSPALWLVAQAVSEILPDGDKEKQLLQGLLNQRESLQSATKGLF